MTQREDGTVKADITLSNISGFDSISRIAATKIGDWYAPSARGIGQFDNICFYEYETSDTKEK